MEQSYEVESCVRGFHIYQDRWTPTIGEELRCIREIRNMADQYAVAVIKAGLESEDDEVVGHLPQTISAACSIFLSTGGTIDCVVVNSRRYSRDLPQGGLEIPCRLIFNGKAKYVSKIKRLVLPPVTEPHHNDVDATVQPPIKKQKIEDESQVTDLSKDDDVGCELEASAPTRVWVCLDGSYILTENDKRIIQSGEELTDNHVNFAQRLLKKQYPGLNGLESTLYLTRSDPLSCTHNYMQIVFSRNSHWIVIATLGCLPGHVNVYDSLYDDVDKPTERLIKHLFGSRVQYTVQDSVPKQQGYRDCGLYAIATCVCLASCCQPYHFDQKNMRRHLVNCFEQKAFNRFPAV